MIHVKSIDHICLWVSSLSEAKYYYETIFGFVCKPRDNDNTTLIVESGNVHFFICKNNDADKYIPQQHLSFEVASLDKVIKTLNKNGITEYHLGEVNFFKHRNYKWCEWKDPNGIRLECVEII